MLEGATFSSSAFPCVRIDGVSDLVGESSLPPSFTESGDAVLSPLATLAFDLATLFREPADNKGDIDGVA